MSNRQLIIIGGFLGSGKTTSILRLANYFADEGKKVGIITNDQGSALVDKEFLKANGYAVLSVERSCFCCRFDEFVGKLSQLAKEELPDIIFAEPIGSGTDIITTIFKPLLSHETPEIRAFAEEFSIAPYSVTMDPRRIRRYMRAEKNIRDEINYLFEKQLEEANILVLNKCDLLTPQDIEEMTAFLRERFHGVKLITASAKNNEHIAEWANELAGSVIRDLGGTTVDRDTCVKAEELLAWYNSSFTAEAAEPIDVNAFVRTFLSCVDAALTAEGAQIAHLKCYAMSRSEFVKGSVTLSSEEPELSETIRGMQECFHLVINARVCAEPATLETAMNNALQEVKERFGLTYGEAATECFQPCRPKPTYQMCE